MARARKKAAGRSGDGAREKAGREDEDDSGRSRALLRARRVGLAIVLLAFVSGLWVAGWLLELDRTVVSRFEGRRFSVPSATKSFWGDGGASGRGSSSSTLITSTASRYSSTAPGTATRTK